MGSELMSINTLTFSEFPEDVQICILSFLTPTDISAFACTSKRYATLCHVDSRIWYALCDRKWGPHTQIRKWCDGNVSSFKLIFNTLSEYDRLIGFWRRSGNGNGVAGDAPIVFFEWGESCVMGSWVFPSDDGSYRVVKSPFIWLGLSVDGQALNYLKIQGLTIESGSSPGSSSSSSPGSSLTGGIHNEMDVVRVNVNFMGSRHVVLEESGIWNGSGSGSGSGSGNGNGKNESLVGVEAGSPPDRVTSEMYRYFANKTSPGAGGERAWRRQRRREKERQGRRKWEPEHLIKIVHCSPTPFRPLQGLWKVYTCVGFCFYC